LIIVKGQSSVLTNEPLFFSLVLLAISAVVHAAEELPGEVREVAKNQKETNGVGKILKFQTL